MTVLHSIEKWLWRCELVLVYASVLAALTMMCLTSADALSRYLLNRPIIGAYEITEKYLMVATIFLGLSFAYRGGVMHAKTASVDGVWSTVGSTNLDWRSFLHNDEMNAVIVGRDFAAQMEKMFANDLTESQQITLAQWKHRPILQRLKERMARIGAYWL